MPLLIAVIVTSLEHAVAAAEGGADQLEADQLEIVRDCTLAYAFWRP